MGSGKQKTKERRQQLHDNSEIFDVQNCSANESCEQSVVRENLILEVERNAEDAEFLSSLRSVSRDFKTRKTKKEALGLLMPAEAACAVRENDEITHKVQKHASKEMRPNRSLDVNHNCDAEKETSILPGKKETKRLHTSTTEYDDSEKSDRVLCIEGESRKHRSHDAERLHFDKGFKSSSTKNYMPDCKTKVKGHGSLPYFEAEQECDYVRDGCGASVGNRDSSSNYKQKKVSKKHKGHSVKDEYCFTHKAPSNLLGTENEAENSSKMKHRKNSFREANNSLELENPASLIESGCKKNKKRYKKHHFVEVGECDDVNYGENSAIKNNYVHTENTSSAVEESVYPLKKKKQKQKDSVEMSENNESASIMNDYMHIENTVKESAHPSEKMKKHLVEMSECDERASVANDYVHTENALGTVEDGVYPSEKRKKKRKQKYPVEISECDERASVTNDYVHTENTSGTVEEGVYLSKKKKKRKQKYPVEISECDERASVTNDYVHTENTLGTVEEGVYLSKKKKKKHKQKHPVEISECDERASVTNDYVHTENILGAVEEGVYPSEKRKKKHKQKHPVEMSECDERASVTNDYVHTENTLGTVEESVYPSKKHKQKHPVEISEYDKIASVTNDYVHAENTSDAAEESVYFPEEMKKKHMQKYSVETNQEYNDLDKMTVMTTCDFLPASLTSGTELLESKNTKKKHTNNSLVTTCEYENFSYSTVTTDNDNSACTENRALGVEFKTSPPKKAKKKHKKKHSSHECEGNVMFSNNSSVVDLDSGVSESKKKHKEKHSHQISDGSQDLFDCASVPNSVSAVETNEPNKTKKKKKFHTLVSESEGNVIDLKTDCDSPCLSSAVSATGFSGENSNLRTNTEVKKQKKRKHSDIIDASNITFCNADTFENVCKLPIDKSNSESHESVNRDVTVHEIDCNNNNLISSDHAVEDNATEKSCKEKTHRKHKKRKHSEACEDSNIVNDRSSNDPDADCFDNARAEGCSRVLVNNGPVQKLDSEFQESINSINAEINSINANTAETSGAINENASVYKTNSGTNLSTGVGCVPDSEKNDGMTGKSNVESEKSQTIDASSSCSPNADSVNRSCVPEVSHSGSNKLHCGQSQARKNTNLPPENDNSLSVCLNEDVSLLRNSEVQFNDCNQNNGTFNSAKDIHVSSSDLGSTTKQSIALNSRTSSDSVTKTAECQSNKVRNSANCYSNQAREPQPSQVSIDVNIHHFVDLDSLDMTVEPLDFDPPVLHSNGFLFGKTKESKKELIDQGISFRSGRWTKKEDSILRQNWQDFVQRCGIKNPMVLLGVNRGAPNRKLQEFTKTKYMYVRLGKGLNDRTLYSIYLRARAILCPRNDSKFTDQDVQTLMSLHAEYGNNWLYISEVMNKPVPSCREAFRWHSNNVKYGKWTKQEDKALTEALSEEVGENAELETRSLPWDKIASHIPFRNASQCRIHWLAELRKKSEGRRRWSMKDDALLIYWMHRNLLENCEVNWDELYEKFRACSASYVHVQRKWLILKMKIPYFTRKDHEDIVNSLYRSYLPTLLSKLDINMKLLECIANGEDLNSADSSD